MRPEDAWNQFLKTGAVSDYMQYRKAFYVTAAFARRIGG